MGGDQLLLRQNEGREPFGEVCLRVFCPLDFQCQELSASDAILVLELMLEHYDGFGPFQFEILDPSPDCFELCIFLLRHQVLTMESLQESMLPRNSTMQ